MSDESEFEFYNETCSTCVYYAETPGHQTWNICRFWIPSSTAINQWAIFPHVGHPQDGGVMSACGCYKRNPFLNKEQTVEKIETPEARPIPEGEQLLQIEQRPAQRKVRIYLPAPNKV